MKKLNNFDFKNENIEEVMNILSVNENGIFVEEVSKRQNEYGKNILEKPKSRRLLNLFKSIFNPFNLILMGLAIVSLFTDIILASEKDYTTFIIIIIMVSLSAIIKELQEVKSNKAYQKLLEMIESKIEVRRSGRNYLIKTSELVIGDIVKLGVGDIIPADVRVIETNLLLVDESSLTGESEYIEKRIEANTDNILYTGSKVASGSAVGIVIKLAGESEYGNILTKLSEKPAESSFDKGIKQISKLLVTFMAIMVPIVFTLNAITTDSLLNSLFFALAIAVGLTPEMLPLIVTCSLARGSIKMGKEKTIVKNINAIENFGSMDILCTDKTGTLTENKISFINSLDLTGKLNKEIHKLAYINAYYQTGYQNPIDEALKESMSDVKFTKLGEIPYDFERRMLTVYGKLNEETISITKGAVNEILNKTKFIKIGNEVVELTKEKLTMIEQLIEKEEAKGYKIIGVAINNELSEDDLTLVGFITLADQVKKTAASAIVLLADLGVKTKVITGDSLAASIKVCEEVGILNPKYLTSEEFKSLPKELYNTISEYDLFVKMTPTQKEEIIMILQECGHTVGFLGDGINDVAALKKSDIGISVDTAKDIAKEAADVILLENDLNVLEKGIEEGRKTYINMMKYIKITASSNFGNMLSILLASAFLPFLPLLSLQILILNLVYDLSSITIPWDNVDYEVIKDVKRWNVKDLKKFIFALGPISSIFDIITYLILFFIICPHVAGGNFNDPNTNHAIFIAAFHAGWFIESMWTQTLVIHFMRTEKKPFIESKASKNLLITSILGVVLLNALPYTILGTKLGFTALPVEFYGYLGGIILGYIILVSLSKKIYLKKNEYLI